MRIYELARQSRAKDISHGDRFKWRLHYCRFRTHSFTRRASLASLGQLYNWHFSLNSEWKITGNSPIKASKTNMWTFQSALQGAIWPIRWRTWRVYLFLITLHPWPEAMPPVLSPRLGHIYNHRQTKHKTQSTITTSTMAPFAWVRGVS